jgi:UDP-galactose transporter B1
MIVAYIFIKLRGQKLDSIDGSILFKFMQLSFLTTISSPFGYAALSHIDYPTVILGKSCKLVPLMLMNFVLYGKTFPAYQYVVVSMITIGVSSFTLMQPSKKV